MPTPGRFIAVLSLLALGGVAGWWMRGGAPGHSAGDADSAAEEHEIDVTETSVAVKTAEVTSGTLPLMTPVLGEVHPAPSALRPVTSRARGRVIEVCVHPGDRVAAGAVLLRFDPQPLAVAVKRAESAAAAAQDALTEFERGTRDQKQVELAGDASKAKTRLSVAEDQVARLEPLAKDGLVSESALFAARGEVEAARTDLDIATRALEAWRASSSGLQANTLVAEVAATRAEVEDARAIAAAAEVTAAAAGQVVDLTIHAGDSCEAGVVLATVLLDEGRIVAFDVAPALIANVTAGAAANVTLADGRTIAGRVSSISSRVEADTGLVEVLVVPLQDESMLRPGGFVRGEIEIGRIESATLVPEAAIVAEDGEERVVTWVGEGVARPCAVEVLGRHAGLAAVRGAVKPGDRVVVDGAYNLPDGARLTEQRE